LRCAVSGDQNVFGLGVYPLGNNGGHLLCSFDVASERNLQLDWRPLVQNGELCGWLSRAPSAEELEENAQVQRKRSLLTKADRPKFDVADQPHYDTLGDLLLRLAKHNGEAQREGRRQHDLRAETNVSVSIGAASTKGAVVQFALRHIAELRLGAQLVVTSPQHGAEFEAKVTKFDGNTVTATLITRAPLGGGMLQGCTVNVSWQGTPYSRVAAALQQLSQNEAELGEYITLALTGRLSGVPRSASGFDGELVLPRGCHLNAAQLQAIRHGCGRPVSLIQGPPGTGKTAVAALLVLQLVIQNRGRILLAAHSNRAVGRLVEAVRLLGVCVVHVVSKYQGLRHLEGDGQWHLADDARGRLRGQDEAALHAKVVAGTATRTERARLK